MRVLPEGYLNTTKAAEHLGICLQTLNNWRKKKWGPTCYADPRGWFAYRIVDLDAWKHRSADASEFKPVHVGVEEKKPEVKIQTGPTKENKGCWIKEGALEKWFPSPEARDAWELARQDPDAPRMVIGPPLTSQEIREKFPVLDNPHGFTLPERKPKHIDVPETPAWLQNIKK